MRAEREIAPCPCKKLLICFALSVLFLGGLPSTWTAISLGRAMSVHRAPTRIVRAGRLKASDGGDNTRRRTLQRQLRRLSWPTSDRRHRSSIGGESRAVERAGILEDRVRRATRDAAVKGRLDGTTDGRYPGLAEDVAMIRKALFKTPPIPSDSQRGFWHPRSGSLGLAEGRRSDSSQVR